MYLYFCLFYLVYFFHQHTKSLLYYFFSIESNVEHDFKGKVFVVAGGYFFMVMKILPNLMFKPINFPLVLSFYLNKVYKKTPG